MRKNVAPTAKRVPWLAGMISLSVDMNMLR